MVTVISSATQNIMGICIHTTILILYQANYKLVIFLKFIYISNFKKYGMFLKNKLK
jgi:hypothetical protein